jgi:hypothetical protein
VNSPKRFDSALAEMTGSKSWLTVDRRYRGAWVGAR